MHNVQPVDWRPLCDCVFGPHVFTHTAECAGFRAQTEAEQGLRDLELMLVQAAKHQH